MREFWNYLIVSYNVWFTAPLTIVFLLALFRLVTGAMDFGDADVDADIDAEADVDMDADRCRYGCGRRHRGRYGVTDSFF